MNRKERVSIKKEIIAFAIGGMLFTLAILGVIYLSQKNFTPWLTYRNDITAVHDMYINTKDVKNLSELEQILQDKKIEYTIDKNQLKTDFFNYNIANKDAIIMEENSYTQNFSSIDNRDNNKVEISIKYKDKQKIETIILNEYRRINDKYYKYTPVLVFLVLSIVVYILISCIVIYCFYYEKKVNLKRSMDKKE